jgi:hypothetical protein
MQQRLILAGLGLLIAALTIFFITARPQLPASTKSVANSILPAVAPPMARSIESNLVSVAGTSQVDEGTLPYEPTPRDTSEWQGMLVNTAQPAACDVTSRCGLALSCRQGRCLPCRVDSDCSSSEGCALDHCVRSERLHCRSRRECGADALCVLTGYSADVRNNATMSAHCSSNNGAAQGAQEAHLAHQDNDAGFTPGVDQPQLGANIAADLLRAAEQKAKLLTKEQSQ